MPFTSFDEDHRHTWNKSKRFTSLNNRHRHRIDLKRRRALPNRKGGHTHRLLSK